MCKQGTDPDSVKDCISYCQRLLMNTIELQKAFPMGQSRYVYYPPKSAPKTMLLEGVSSDASFLSDLGQEDSVNHQATDASSLIDLTMAASVRQNKLMDHGSLMFLMSVCIGVGILFLFFTFISQKGKSGGHSYLPRPNQAEPLSPKPKHSSSSA